MSSSNNSVSTYQLIARLQRQGMPMDPSIVENLSRGLRVRQLDIYIPTRIGHSEPGETLFVSDLQVTCDVPSLQIAALQLDLGWGSFDFPSYPGGDEISGVKVINGSLCGRYRRGDALRGLLIGVSATPIPSHLRHGDRIQANFTFFGTLGEVLSYTLRAVVDLKTSPSRRHGAHK